MGYHTEFEGEIRVDPPLNADEQSFLEDFIETRHMNRVKGPLHISTGYNSFSDLDVIDGNNPDSTKPGLWCKWETADNGHVIRWSGAEKFYDSEEWMQYLIDNLFSKSGKKYVTLHHSGDARLNNFTFNHVFNGMIEAQGEEPTDKWILVVKDNVVSRQDR